jgi:hypothetical protein
MAARKTTSTPAKRAYNRKTPVQKALAKLDAEDKQALADAILQFPEGCEQGKFRFMKEVGLPTPNAYADVNIYVRVPLEADEYENKAPGARWTSYGLTDATQKVWDTWFKEIASTNGLLPTEDGAIWEVDSIVVPGEEE